MLPREPRLVRRAIELAEIGLRETHAPLHAPTSYHRSSHPQAQQASDRLSQLRFCVCAVLAPSTDMAWRRTIARPANAARSRPGKLRTDLPLQQQKAGGSTR